MEGKLPPHSDAIANEFLKNAKVENLLNREGDQLPFGLYNPATEGKLIWMCGEDAEKRITSVFLYDFGDRKEKACAYVENMEKAIYMRDELYKDGWKKIIPPEITFTMKNDRGEDKPLTRKQRRYLAKKIKAAAKKDLRHTFPSTEQEERPKQDPDGNSSDDEDKP
jgi:hypothetical protein